MTRQGGFDRNMRALTVAHLADHDDVGVRAHNRAQAGDEGDARALMDLNLLDARKAVLDRVLDRHDRLLGRADDDDAGIERRRLARARGAGREDRAMRTAQRTLDALAIAVVHAQIGERARRVARVEHAQDGRVADHERHGDDTDVDPAPVERERHAPVLRRAPLGDVQLAEDLDARDDPRRLARRDGCDVAHDGVHAVAHEQRAVVGVEVDVGGSLADRLGDDRSHEPDGWTVVGGTLERGIALRLLDGLGLLPVDQIAEALTGSGGHRGRCG